MKLNSNNTEFTHVDYIEPHLARTKEILSRHPEMKGLFGNTPSTSLFVLGLVLLQLIVGIALIDQAAWIVLLASWTIGALTDHALWTLIHDCSHNLVFKGSTANRWLAIFANFPIVFPSAITFRNYHLVHHRHQGEVDYDADLATPFERRLAGRNPLGKSLWFLFFPLWQPLRIARLKVPPFDRWVLINLLVQVSFLGGLTYFSGSWIPLVYMTLSSTFAVGFHPVGARWIQEHYIIPGFGAQETYSYYGPLNILAFNVGFHNEHHDFMMVPWSKLPRVKQIAPEYYNSIHSHTSWTKLWLRFLFDSKMSLGSRIVRQRIHDHTSQCLPVPTGSNTVQDLTTETVCEMPLSRQGYSS